MPLHSDPAQRELQIKHMVQGPPQPLIDHEIDEYNRLCDVYKEQIDIINKSNTSVEDKEQAYRNLYHTVEDIKKAIDKLYCCMAVLAESSDYPDEDFAEQHQKIYRAINQGLSDTELTIPSATVTGLRDDGQYARIATYTPPEFKTRVERYEGGSSHQSNLITAGNSYTETLHNSPENAQLPETKIPARTNPFWTEWVNDPVGRPAMDSIKDRIVSNGRNLRNEIVAEQNKKKVLSAVTFGRTHNDPVKNKFLEAASAYLENPSPKTYESYKEAKQSLDEAVKVANNQASSSSPSGKLVMKTDNSSVIALAGKVNKHVQLMEKYEPAFQLHTPKPGPSAAP
jgi:hypothetical protein